MEVDGLVRIAKTYVAPAVRYFRERLNKNGTEMYDGVCLFNAVRICCPMQAHDLHLTAQDVEDLRIVPILHDDALVSKLLEELPAYLVAAADAVIDTHTIRLQWRRRRTRPPSWESAAKTIFSLLPSSATTERVFSLLSGALSNQQGNLFEDHIQTMLMLQYNRS